MCNHKCETHIYKPYLERIKYLVKLPDDTKLNNLVLIGTHHSLSYAVDVKESQTQDLNIAQQLKYGIRVFDVGVKLQSSLFKIYIDNAPANIEFAEALTEIQKFLDLNPGEFVVMFLRQVTVELLEITRSHCEVIDYYIKNAIGGNRFVKKWHLSDTIGQHRGKILLASSDYLFTECCFDLNINCLIQNDEINYKTTKKHFNLYNKWESIIDLLQQSYNKRSKCLINDISFSDGHNSRRAIAKDGGYYFGDNCAIPLNHMVTENFVYSYIAMNIYLADFPTQELIDVINDINFLNSSWRSEWH
ncbi:uncharacterized protein LOC103572022 [Microplitis demolitor]|uniref:uncharacterized protein LOC103572022 n=1 Tax=Microplitis demolitor TaxID=69319 RepID=UPI0004CD5E8E|nr:uncharacterized protein LOC103572022 [Microplitis demolitor]